MFGLSGGGVGGIVRGDDGLSVSGGEGGEGKKNNDEAETCNAKVHIFYFLLSLPVGVVRVAESIPHGLKPAHFSGFQCQD